MKIDIDIGTQKLTLLDDAGRAVRTYQVSTATNGVGEQFGSNCTPGGRHIVRAKIGGGKPLRSVFRGRRPTGEIWSRDLQAKFPMRDWILTRILWLSGCEPGKNRLGNVDTMRRMVYIHGTADDAPMGVPESHGCIRMRNDDVAELFDLVPPYTVVEIHP